MIILIGLIAILGILFFNSENIVLGPKFDRPFGGGGDIFSVSAYDWTNDINPQTPDIQPPAGPIAPPGHGDPPYHCEEYKIVCDPNVGGEGGGYTKPGPAGDGKCELHLHPNVVRALGYECDEDPNTPGDQPPEQTPEELQRRLCEKRGGSWSNGECTITSDSQPIPYPFLFAACHEIRHIEDFEDQFFDFSKKLCEIEQEGFKAAKECAEQQLFYWCRQTPPPGAPSNYREIRALYCKQPNQGFGYPLLVSLNELLKRFQECLCDADEINGESCQACMMEHQPHTSPAGQRGICLAYCRDFAWSPGPDFCQSYCPKGSNSIDCPQIDDVSGLRG